MVGLERFFAPGLWSASLQFEPHSLPDIFSDSVSICEIGGSACSPSDVVSRLIELGVSGERRSVSLRIQFPRNIVLRRVVDPFSAWLNEFGREGKLSLPGASVNSGTSELQSGVVHTISNDCTTGSMSGRGHSHSRLRRRDSSSPISIEEIDSNLSPRKQRRYDDDDIIDLT